MSHFPHLNFLAIVATWALGGNAAFAQTPPPAHDFARHAMQNQGDAIRGKAQFEAEASRCTVCHSIDGSSSKLGPDLGAIGDKFDRADLIRAVIEPSAVIAVGYGMTTVETISGKSFAGVVKSSSAETIEMIGADGVAVAIPTIDLKSQGTTEISLMPPGLHLTMGPAGFTDLIAYLQSLRVTGEAGQAGNPSRIPQAGKAARFEPLFETVFDHPTWFGWIPGRGTHAAMVLEHTGRLWQIEKTNGQEMRRLVLDLRGIVRPGGATGLLGMAFHPNYPQNRRYFLKYHVVENGVISTVIDERRMHAERDEDSGQPPRQIIKIRSVTQDHNGGSVAFGPDGYLYFGIGDTGPQRDPQGHGQDLGILLGKMSRIDVDHRDGDQAYSIPQDNPFVGIAGVRPEIWASGFREPYRFSWDAKTGDLWVGDVGQDRIEEVSIVRKGENLGWNVYEGHQAYSERYRRGGENYVTPVMSYSHRHGVSVTGGFVYHGRKSPQLEGWYVFGDYESRRVWALKQADRKLQEVVEIGRAPSRITAFASDDAGELYLVGFNDGLIQRLILDDVDPRPLTLRTLVETSERSPAKWQFRTDRPAATWQEEKPNDSGWGLAPGGFGTRGTPGAVARTPWTTSDIWLRREFEVSPELAAANGELVLRLHHDEDVEVFLNGSQVLARNGWTQGYIELRLPAGNLLKAGPNMLAIHCRQNGGGQYIDAGLSMVVPPKQESPR
ncbi:MAG: PQQ-dependent sugar dehydrogenase [Verrucomicrobiota bacterium]